MKKVGLFIIIMQFIGFAFSQANYYPFVLLNGTGETTYAPMNGFDYSHHTNYSTRIKSITAKWSFRTLMGEPVIDGVFKWEAALGTPADYLDYRDCILLEISGGGGVSMCIKISPTVMKSSEGYGFNTPGSPSWEDVFCNWEGESMKHEIPNWSAQMAKDIWKKGFYVTGIHLIREGGDDGYLVPEKENAKTADDFWNSPENRTTRDDLKKKEAIEKQKQLTEQAKTKYKALNNPFTWNVNNMDTVFDAEIQIVKSLNPYFYNGKLTLSSVSNGKVNSTVSNINSNVQLVDGWNTLLITLKGENYNLKDSVRVYYKINDRFGTMIDQQGNVYKTVKIGNQVWMAENFRYKASSGCWAYNDDERNVKMYGYLYDWNTAISVCPPGWHLPSKAEWVSLIETLGGKEVASTAMKNTTGWNENGINSSGFSALPGGFYTYYGKFQTLGYLGVWWSASTSDNLALIFSIGENKDQDPAWNKDRKLSVRYVRDF